MKLWKRCLALPLFSFLQNAICYTMRILCIMNTFSILDDFIFFFFLFFLFFFSTIRVQGNFTFVTLPYPSAAHISPSLLPPLLSLKACRGHYQRTDLSSGTSRFTTSRACGFGKISRDCLDLLDIPFHTFSLCFPHVSGSEIFFFSFLIFFLAHPSPAHPSRLISERKRQKD